MEKKFRHEVSLFSCINNEKFLYGPKMKTNTVFGGWGGSVGKIKNAKIVK